VGALLPVQEGRIRYRSEQRRGWSGMNDIMKVMEVMDNTIMDGFNGIHMYMIDRSLRVNELC
jgi:hypothetical protein